MLISAMALSFAAPVAASATVAEDVAIEAEATYQQITPFIEMTRIYHRWSICGCMGLQFRVWGITSGRWLTDWDYV